MKYSRVFLPLFLALLLVGCAPGIASYGDSTPGFFWGVWHGWIAPVSILWHFLFDANARVYETTNSGIGYDIGFYVAIISGFGSLSLKRYKKQ